MLKTNININTLEEKVWKEIYQSIHNVISEWRNYGLVSKLSTINRNIMNEENYI